MKGRLRILRYERLEVMLWGPRRAWRWPVLMWGGELVWTGMLAALSLGRIEIRWLGDN